MAAEPTLEEIMFAIRDSGYLMEQEVATQLEQRGLHVRTNVAFEDLEEGKSREIDVTAIKRVALNEEAKIAAYIELIVECKNSSNPFVFIARPKNEYDKNQVPEEFVFPFQYYMKKDLGGGRSSTKNVPAFNHLGFREVSNTHNAAWKAVQFCRIDRKGGGWHANHGGLYDSIFYPMAKAIVARKKDMPRGTRPDDWQYFWFFFPLVVTSGDLFLIDATAENPEPKAVDHVTFQRELKSGKLSGSFTLTFVRQQALEGLISLGVDPIVTLVSQLVADRLNYVKNADVPWMD